MVSKKARENAAANAVATHLEAVLGIAMTVRPWDDGSVNGMHDFYIEGDGRKIALEVTTMADARRVGRDVRWSREAPDGLVKVDGLTGCWTAHHEGDAEASDVVRALQIHLPQLEALGITHVDARSWQEHLFAPESRRPLSYEHARALNLVGIVQANLVADASGALLQRHGGEVQVIRGFGTYRPSDRNFPVTVIDEHLREPELHRSDVQKLLAVKDATGRHIWMWVELTEGLAMIRSFETEGHPEVDLDADGIDGVWLGRSPAPNVVAGHAWVRDYGWSKFSVARNEVIAE